MKKRSFFGRLTLSIVSLLVSLIMLVTSSYAWFSMNRLVTATGLEVTVDSNSVYLLIGTVNDINTIQTAGTTTVDFGMTTAQSKVFPAAHETIANATAALTPANWYYQIADVPSASASTKAKNYLTNENFDKYVIHKVCYITVTPGSNPAENLVVDGVTITSNSTATGAANATTIAPAKIVIASSTAVVELDSVTTSSTTVLAATITDQTLVKIDVFLYYDGNNISVYTNNIANLDGAVVDISFAVDQ